MTTCIPSYLLKDTWSTYPAVQISAESAVPPLDCPITPRFNPQAELAQANSLAWAVQFGLVRPQSRAYQKLQVARFGWLAARTYPEASAADLSLISYWATWFFLHDDLCDESEMGTRPQQLAALDAHFSNILEGTSAPDPEDPFALALADMSRQMSERMGEAWCGRFAHSVQQCFQANYWEACGRQTQSQPDLPTYLKMRPFTGAVYTGFNLIHLAWNIDPNSSFLRHLLVEQLAQMAGNLICWHNDILSLPKELQEENPYNLVLILQRERHLTLTEAKRQAIQMCNQEMAAYLQLLSQCPSFGDETVAAWRYLHGLTDWIRGHLDWCRETSRYYG
ncbi:MAG: hypothetical protein KJ063_19255 [Anaerolineae bacterium]|nr:hypothetical protein [Anaerolineae bacterium]